MNWDALAQTIVVTLFGSGGVWFIWTIFRSVIAWRDSAEGREDKAIARLERFEENCREQLTWERQCNAWSNHRIGELEHALAQAGIPLPPEQRKPIRVVSSDIT